MMKPVFARTLLLAFASLTLPVLAAAGPGPHDCPGAEGRLPRGPAFMEGAPHPEPLPPFLRGVTLSREQQDRLFQLMHAQMPTLRATHLRLLDLHEALRQAALSDTSDDKRLADASAAVARAEADLTLARARIDQQIYRLLTPEQRKQVQARAARGPGATGDRPAGPSRDGDNG